MLRAYELVLARRGARSAAQRRWLLGFEFPAPGFVICCFGAEPAFDALLHVAALGPESSCLNSSANLDRRADIAQR